MNERSVLFQVDDVVGNRVFETALPCVESCYSPLKPHLNVVENRSGIEVVACCSRLICYDPENAGFAHHEQLRIEQQTPSERTVVIASAHAMALEGPTLVFVGDLELETTHLD